MSMIESNPNINRGMLLGVTPAKVSDINDPEGMGRVKVEIINMGTKGQMTGFIRVASPMAGENCGIQFLPSVGDEVLVAFCGDGMSQPYVIGSLYNNREGYKMPSPVKDGVNDIRMIKTKSGHTITFGDKKGEENIEIKSAKEMTIKIDDKENSIKISDKEGKNLMTLNAANGTISITADQKLELKAAGSGITMDNNGVQIKSGNKLEMEGSQVSVKGSATVKVEANSKLDLTSSGQTNVGGSIVKVN